MENSTGAVSVPKAAIVKCKRRERTVAARVEKSIEMARGTGVDRVEHQTAKVEPKSGESTGAARVQHWSRRLKVQE